MSTAEEIANLKVEIEGYRAMLLDPATPEARKDRLIDLITARSQILHDLLATPTAPTAEIVAIVQAIVAPLQKQISELAIDHNLSNYDVWTETGRSEKEQKQFKNSLCTFYDRKPHALNLRKRGKLRCMVTNQWLPADIVIASHIWPHAQHGNGLHKFNLNRSDCSSVRNGLLMVKCVEKKFDWKHLCIIYDSFSNSFRVKVLNPSLMDEALEGTKPALTFRNIDNCVLQHPPGNIPFRRLLSWHARCSFKFARGHSWITEEDERNFEPYHELSETASVPDG